MDLSLWFDIKRDYPVRTLIWNLDYTSGGHGGPELISFGEDDGQEEA
jgi:hypothetical protein